MGFYLGADGLSCHDIDECKINNGNCSQKCVNTRGSHSCACYDGYVNTGPNGTDVICIDIGKAVTHLLLLFLAFFFCFGLFLCLLTWFVLST